VLANKKLSDTFGVSLPHWEMQLRSVFSEELGDMHAQSTNEEHQSRK
jgi:hypothetical protein